MVLTLVLLPRLDRQTKSGAWFSALDGAGATVHLVGGGDVLLGAGESKPDGVMGHAGLGTLAADEDAKRAAAQTQGLPPS